jgi:hypothetical protein
LVNGISFILRILHSQYSILARRVKGVNSVSLQTINDKIYP